MAVVEGDSKSLFQKLLHQGVLEGANPFSGLLHILLIDSL